MEGLWFLSPFTLFPPVKSRLLPFRGPRLLSPDSRPPTPVSCLLSPVSCLLLLTWRVTGDRFSAAVGFRVISRVSWFHGFFTFIVVVIKKLQKGLAKPAAMV
jgi:hypothetical protein